MQEFASKVVQKVEREGGRVEIGEEGEVKIYMDGKLQDVIHKDDRRVKDMEGLAKINAFQPAKEHFR